MSDIPKIKAIILAAGTGERFQNEIPKQFVKIAGLPVIVHTLKTFNSFREIDEIIILTVKEFIDKIWELVSKYSLEKVKKVVVGGAYRQESSKIGIDCCGEDTDFVLIHDAVRPFISHVILSDLIKDVMKHKAVDTVIASPDTIVEVDEENFIKSIPNRANLRRGQTPQAFEYNLIKTAHHEALASKIFNSTDDCSLVLKLGHKVHVVNGDDQNIKITYPLDLHIADKLFQVRGIDPYIPFDSESIKKIINDKVFVIVGGSSGIGLELANKLKDYTQKVYSFSRNTDPSLDVTDVQSIKSGLELVWEKEKRIDYLINSAGTLIKRDVEFMSEKEWDLVYEINIKGNFNIAKAVLPYFRDQNEGNLIFIGSSSYTRGRGGYAAYCSSKAALVNFCQALAEEVGDTIKVNLISPSRVNTPLRYRNFGKEDPNTLLAPEKVADAIIQSFLLETSGSVFDVF